ncbi:MAG: HAMP domain-containing histidine kinase [Planctomycetes bacterium]|nr:HAMP domain-containing histidine kinase [Planctomycetota bacterium]
MTAPAADLLPGVLAHELRNPLASAMAGVLVARDLVDDDDPRAAVLDGAVRDLQRVADLTDGWLALARGRAVPGGVADLGEALAAVAARHGAEMSPLAGQPSVVGQTALLERLFDNLCDNARRAGARSLRLTALRRTDDYVVHVDDDGAGVAAADAERVFQPGWTTRGGAGLGLYAVAATAAAFGGSVRCEPQPRGSRFTVVLPAAATRTVGA